MARLRYPVDHWARLAPSEEHLAAYLARANGYNLAKIRIFERLLGDDLGGRQVLDYGGGGGFMTVLCAERGAHVTLVDAEPTALETAMLLADKRGVGDRIRTICSEEFPHELCEHRFDVVILKDVIEHIPDDGALLRRLGQCQNSGGRLLLSTHNAWSLNFLVEGAYNRWWRGDKNWFGWDPTHLRFYTPRSLQRSLRGAGYASRRWSGLYLVPYDPLSWCLLGRRHLHLDAFYGLERLLGRWFPLNRLGWNLVVEGVRSSKRSA